MMRVQLKSIPASFIFLFLFVGFSDAKVPEAHEDCTRCHIEAGSPLLIKGINETCVDCHRSSTGKEHPVDVVQNEQPGSLPLDKDKRITCITCHEPHGKDTAERLLRMTFNKLCVVCHILP